MALSQDNAWMEDQPSPYQRRDITHFPDWHGLIALDAFFNNLTSALMICACLAWGAGAPVFTTLLPYATTVALALLCIDLGLLVADLGDPARFFHALRVMRFTSPLSVGVWGLACYGTFLGAATAASWLLFACHGDDSLLTYILAALTKLCVIMALIAAIVVICYKGVVFSCSSQPGLRQARWLTPFMVSDSLLMGMGLYMILTLAAAPYLAALTLIIPMIVLLAARCITFALVWQDVKERARKVYTRKRNRFMGAVVYGFGGILPLILLFYGAWGMIIAALLLFCASFLERKWLIGIAGTVRVCRQLTDSNK